jgi:hypothetical protein
MLFNFIYSINHPADKLCLISNLTEQKWSRTIMPSLFMLEYGAKIENLI